jgi:hypothetical protein
VLLCAQVRGKNPPRPIRAWTQSGISSKVLEMLRKQGFDRPLAIQAQVRCTSFGVLERMHMFLHWHQQQRDTSAGTKNRVLG